MPPGRQSPVRTGLWSGTWRRCLIRAVGAGPGWGPALCVPPAHGDRARGLGSADAIGLATVFEQDAAQVDGLTAQVANSPG